MEQRERALSLLSQAEVSLAVADEQLEKKNLKELKGEITAVCTIINRIRRESVGMSQI